MPFIITKNGVRQPQLGQPAIPDEYDDGKPIYVEWAYLEVDADGEPAPEPMFKAGSLRADKESKAIDNGDGTFTRTIPFTYLN